MAKGNVLGLRDSVSVLSMGVGERVTHVFSLVRSLLLLPQYSLQCRPGQGSSVYPNAALQEADCFSVVEKRHHNQSNL